MVKQIIKDLLNNPLYTYVYMRKIWRMSKGCIQRPTIVRIELTDMCNTTCIMCPRQKLTRTKGMMKGEIFEKIINDCIRLAVPKMLFSGFGEPLLDKEIANRIKYAKERGIAEVHLITNASLMDEDRALQILDSGLDLLAVSLDTTNGDVYQKIKPGINFNAVLENITRLLKLKQKIQKTKPHIKIRLTEFNDSGGDERCLERLKKLGAEVVYPGLHNWSGQWECSMARQNGLTKFKRWPCPLLWTSFTVLCDGRVPLCCKDFNSTFNFGNVGENSLAEIWQCREWEAVRVRHMALRSEDMDLCRACEFTRAPTMWWRL